MRVMDEGPAPPAVGVNENVAETPDFPDTRLTEEIMNTIDETAPPITPDETLSDIPESLLV